MSDKTGLVDFARGLAARGLELVSTGGTARRWPRPGCRSPTCSDVTGFPEMMDGRVKTLHPPIHGGILARRDQPDDLAAPQRARHRPHRRRRRQPVSVRAHRRRARRRRSTSSIEQIDIGGPSLVRAAAKNFHDVLVVVDPGRLPGGARRARRPAADAGVPLRPGAQGLRPHRGLRHGDRRDARHGRRSDGGFDRSRRRRPLAPPRLVARGRRSCATCATARIRIRRRRGTRVGDGRGLGAADVLQGKELSFTNLLDLDAAARIVLEFDEPAAAVIKHTNPCGVATGAPRRRGLSCARATPTRCRPSAASSASTGRSTSRRRSAITSTFIEAVDRPGGRRRRARDARHEAEHARVVVDAEAFAPPTAGLAREVRSILGALLVQERDVVTEAATPWPARRTCGRDAAAADAPRSGRRCASRGASART